jgi:hypothetical protein
MALKSFWFLHVIDEWVYRKLEQLETVRVQFCVSLPWKTEKLFPRWGGCRAPAKPLFLFQKNP